MAKTILLTLAGLMLVIAGCSTGNARTVSPGGSAPVTGSMKGNQAHDFVLQSLDGTRLMLSDLRGKPVIINFWTTWCPYCVEEMPMLEQVHRKWSPKGVTMLAIDVQESADVVRKALDGKGFTFTILLDSRGETARKYGVTGFPTTFFIDGDGIIRDKRVGAFPSVSSVETSLKRIVP